MQPSASILAADAAGNSYVAGRFRHTTQFGSTTLTPAPNTSGGDGYDIYVAKLDATGNYLWAVRAGSTADDEATALTVDPSGQVYVTGQFRGTVSFGATTLTAVPYTNTAPGFGIFVARLDANGTWQWAMNAGETLPPTAIRLDGSGNIYLAGTFAGGPATLGTTVLPNPPTINLPATTNTSDGYLAKLSPTGAWQWVTHVGADGYNSVDFRDLAVDAAGNCYLAGYIIGQMSFGPTTLNAPVGPSFLNRGFVAKLSPSGNWLWAVPAGSVVNPNSSGINKIALDGSGNAYVTGEALGYTLDFGTITLTTTTARRRIFVAKLDAAGTWLWAMQTGGTNIEASNGIAVDNAGNAYVTGAFLNSTSFDAVTLTGVPSGTMYGVYDAFVVKLASAGAVQWAVRAGGESDDKGQAIALDGRGGVYLTGQAASTAADFGAISLASAPAGGFWARLTDLALSTRAAAAARSFSVYPNPSRAAATVAGLPAGTPVALYDACGRCVARHTVPLVGPLLLPTQLPSGLYMVRAGAYAQPLLVE